MADEATETPTPEGEDQSQSTQAPPEGTSAAQQTESPEFFSDQFDVNTLDEPLQQRYREMHADYTRKTQEVAEQRKQAESIQALYNDLQSEDPQVKTNALQWMAQNGLLTEDQVAQVFGFEITEQDDEGEPEPYLTRAEWEQHQAQARQQEEATKASRAEEEFVAAADAHIAAQFKAIESKAGELTDDEKQLVVSRALVAHTDPQTGFPDVQAAYKELDAAWNARQKGWAGSKTGSTQPGGQAATEVPDLDTHQARVQHMIERLTPDAGPG